MVDVSDHSAEAMAVRLRTAFDLYSLGESIRRAQLRRERPDATDAEIETLLVGMALDATEPLSKRFRVAMSTAGGYFRAATYRIHRQ